MPPMPVAETPETGAGAADSFFAGSGEQPAGGSDIGDAALCFPVELVQLPPGYKTVASPALGLIATIDHDDGA